MSEADFPTFQTILYDEHRPGVARVTLNRAEKRNAQNMQVTYGLNAALDPALRESYIKIIVLVAVGHHFRSGPYSREMEIYLEIPERWRNISKPMHGGLSDVAGLRRCCADRDDDVGLRAGHGGGCAQPVRPAREIRGCCKDCRGAVVLCRSAGRVVRSAGWDDGGLNQDGRGVDRSADLS